MLARLVLAIFLLFAGFLTYGAPVPAQSKHQLKKTLRSYDKKMRRLSKKMDTIEKKLEDVNKQTLNLTSRRLDLENQMYALKTTMLEQQDLINNQIHQARRSLVRLTLNRMGEQSTSSNLIVEKVLVTKLQKDLVDYRLLQKKMAAKDEKLARLTKRMKEYHRNQLDLKSLMTSLEEEKKNKVQTFVSLRKQRQLVDSKYKSLKKKSQSSKLGLQIAKKIGLFTAPIEKKTSIDFKKKGVTFVFNEEQPVLCTRAGKVVYRGTLSAYGNVVMIDHGQETRSVLLGEFKPKVKKGAMVKEGQVLGYAKPSNGRDGKVYFEVRSRDKVHETVHLLKDNMIAKN